MTLYCPEMGVFDNAWELFWYNFSIWSNVTPRVRIKELFYDKMKLLRGYYHTIEIFVQTKSLDSEFNNLGIVYCTFKFQRPRVDKRDSCS